jgi:hypothetical protein
MGVGGLAADGDLFEPAVAMETEQEVCDFKRILAHNRSLVQYMHTQQVHVQCMDNH